MIGLFVPKINRYAHIGISVYLRNEMSDKKNSFFLQKKTEIKKIDIKKKVFKQNKKIVCSTKSPESDIAG